MVMISSTIGELKVERQQIADALTNERLADGWLFELHATAAGEPPEARYLDVARTCDLYVVVVAEQGSEATEAEYEAAYRDNPRKILPFFIGDSTSATQAFRKLLEKRHTRVARNKRNDLAAAVVEAIGQHVRSGEIVRSSLLERLDDQLRRAERVVSTSMPLAFIPTLREDRGLSSTGSDATSPATNVLARESHILLEGIGGSGKTYGALAMASHASTAGKLPVILRPSSDSLSVRELVQGEFEAARFFPGATLLQEMLRDGRLAIVIDGIDALAVDDRRIVLADVTDLARKYPRSIVICCVRRALPEELPHFARFTIAALTDEQIGDLFRSVNIPQVKDFPSQVADLARWPLWAWALLEVGPSVPTGLVLLQRLLDHRIKRSAAYSAIETELLASAGAAIAFVAWPQPSMPALRALTVITDWGARPQVRERFDVPAAETIIERLSAAGIIQLTPEVEFAHPLFATYLGAKHAATEEPMTAAMATDPEFAMFVTALLTHERTDEILANLKYHGPVGQARYLRLVAEEPRKPDEDDAITFGTLTEALTGSAAECIVTDEWTAWRTASTPRMPGTAEVEEWLARGEVNFMQGNVFERRRPIDLAAIESLARFKDLATRQRPHEDRFERPRDDEFKSIRKLPRAELDELILQAVLDWRTEWRQQAVAMGISTLPETTVGDGDPHVTVAETWPDPGLLIEWGKTARVEWVQPDGNERDWRYQPLSRFLEPGRSARIYDDLARRAERALGCAFSSQAWARPEHVAAWAW